MAKIAKKVVDVDAGLVRFEFVDGVNDEARLDTLPESIVRQLALHGLSQKLGDTYASAGDKGWSVADCREQVSIVYNNLAQGVFNATGGGSGSSVMAEALGMLTGKSAGEAVQALQTLTDESRKELAKRPDMKAAMARIRAERAQAKLAGFGDTEGDMDELIDMFR